MEAPRLGDLLPQKRKQKWHIFCDTQCNRALSLYVYLLCEHAVPLWFA